MGIITTSVPFAERRIITMKISIVVPIYNSAAYLEECVDSLINQTYRDIEIILVDDGSTDDSSLICDKLEKRDNRVIVIHKENGGNNSARKAGTNAATGEFILYVDSDDWIDNNTCEVVLKQALNDNADVVRFALQREYPNGRTKTAKDNLKEGLYTQEDSTYLYENLIYNNNISGTNNSQCTQLTRTYIFKQNYQMLDDSVQYGEDYACVIMSILNASRVLITHDVYYHYRMREGSITHKSNPNYYTQINSLYLFLQDLCVSNPYAELLLPQVERYMDVLVLRGINSRFIQPREPLVPDYFFYSNQIPINSRIVIYGAGVVGKSYERQFRCQNQYKIIGWVDKYPQKEFQEGVMILPVSDLLRLNFDYVIIAIQNKETAYQIRNELTKNLHLDNKKIIWERPMHIFDYYYN